MTWLDSPLVSLDTETSGLSVEQDRVITACIGHSARPGAWAPRQWLINPGVPIPAEATAIHGITQEAAGRGADPRVALAEIAAVLSDCARGGVPVVIFNASYDLTLLDREFRRHLGAELPVGLLVLDTLVLFRRFDLTTGGRRLEQLAARHGITFPAHDATADALASLRLLHILAADNDLLPLVSVHDLQPLQAKWHAAHQTAAASKRLGNGQSADGFDTHWPMRPFTEQEPSPPTTVVAPPAACIPKETP